MNIAITIADDKVAEVKQAFLRVNPVPLDDDTHQPLFTENQWMKEWMRKQFRGVVREGKKRLILDNASIEEIEIT